MQHLFLFLFLEPFIGGLAGVCWIIALLSCKKRKKKGLRLKND